MANCKKIADMLGAHVYGDLSPDEMREVREHIEECGKCAEDLKSRIQVASLIPSQVPALSDEDRQRIMWSVKGAVRASEEKVRPRLWKPIFVGSLAAAVLLIALVGTGQIKGTRGRKVTANATRTQTDASRGLEAKKDIAKGTKPTTEPVVGTVEILASGPERLDRRPETYRGKNRRQNRREQEKAERVTSTNNPNEGVPVAPSADSSNSADLGRLSNADDQTNGNSRN